MSRRKPTPGYIALMEKLQENAILEADQANTDKVKEAMKKVEQVNKQGICVYDAPPTNNENDEEDDE